MTGWSLTRRLQWTLVGALSGLWLVAAIASAVTGYQEINEVFDDALAQSARRLLPLVAVAERHPEEDEDAEDRARDDDGDLDEDSEDGDDDNDADYLIYQVRDADGHVLLRSADAPRAPFAVPPIPGYGNGAGFRIYSLPTTNGDVIIQVAQPLAQRWEVVADSLLWLLLPLVVLAPLAGGAIYLIVSRVRRPLTQVQQALDARSGSNLAPVPGDGLPDELTPIVDDVNRLLERLNAALEGERMLAANSAHELRTPVAAARAQAQRLAARLEGGPEHHRATEMVTTLERLGNLTEKLLQLARAEAGVALSSEIVDLLPVIRLLVDDNNRHPRSADRLTLVTDGLAALQVRADLDAAGIALQNLIDNAVAHGTPGTPIAIMAAADGSIHVTNAGPAVPPAVLPLLTRRFERNSATAPGSGLGLAIVDTIMRQSGGSLDLISPATGRSDGFEAVLRFASA